MPSCRVNLSSGQEGASGSDLKKCTVPSGTPGSRRHSTPSGAATAPIRTTRSGFSLYRPRSCSIRRLRVQCSVGWDTGSCARMNRTASASQESSVGRFRSRGGGVPRSLRIGDPGAVESPRPPSPSGCGLSSRSRRSRSVLEAFGPKLVDRGFTDAFKSVRTDPSLGEQALNH